MSSPLPTPDRPNDPTESALYVGQVRHRRFTPKEHAFSYPLYYLYLDIDNPEALRRASKLWEVQNNGASQSYHLRPASWHRADHFRAPEVPLRVCLDQLLRRKLGRPLLGRVNLLTQGRFLGFGFNPVSFFYCWNEAGTALDAIVAEVSNTPWREKHHYVLDMTAPTNPLRQSGKSSNTAHKIFEFDKQFHVSPFLDMDYHYKWRFSTPARRLAVHMENWRNETLAFDAALTLSHQPLTPENLRRTFWSFPLMSWRVVAGIYIEASRLWRKGVKFHPHPRRV